MTSDFGIIAGAVWNRFMELLAAPATEPDMLWFAIPLIFATFMMTLYYGRYRKEVLGWNTAFENTMIFLFVSFDLFRQMYESMEPYSWMNIYNNPLYFSITIGLAAVSFFSMILVYYHLLPKKLAFMLFAKLPINIALYVTMCIVYVNVAANWITVGAGILLFLLVWIIVKLIQIVQGISAKKQEDEEHGDWEEEGNGEYELDDEDIKKGASRSLTVKEAEAKKKAARVKAVRKKRKK
ncbi:MAG: hypothetical protein GY852_06080 [bacterium]|nr:hypothetical protein [bacterium]